jgi:putative ATPase
LFVDEIHRFNRAQQDGFLPVAEEGIITLVGATTENPSFRAERRFAVALSGDGAQAAGRRGAGKTAQRAEALEGTTLPLTEDAREGLIAMADGDGRYMLNLAEELIALKPETPLDLKDLSSVLQKRAPVYDKDREEHYNLISALHKSVRGSDPMPRFTGWRAC